MTERSVLLATSTAWRGWWRARIDATCATLHGVDPAAFLDGHPVALSVYEEVCARLSALGPFDLRTTKSQIAFRRKRGFAYLWLPGQYLQNPGAEVVLSIALGREVRSGRFKEVVHPAERHWMHHLEVHGPDEIDDEVVEWLAEAFERAG